MLLEDLNKDRKKMNEDIRLDIARKVLETALGMVDRKMDPDSRARAELETRIYERKEAEKKQDNLKKAVFGVIGFAAVGAFCAALYEGVKEMKQAEAAMEDARQKELYRKLSNIKGRS